MKKIFAILIFVLFSTSIFSETVYVIDSSGVYESEQKKLNMSDIQKDVKEIKTQMDSAAKEGKTFFNIIFDTYKEFGLKETLKIHAWFFIPLFIFVVLFLLYLKGPSGRFLE